MGLRATGVVRKNRLLSAPVRKENEMRNRGDCDSVSDGNILLVRLHDSTFVNLMTNYDAVEPKKTTRRRDKHGMSMLSIPRCFHNYNLHKGGVDMVNRFTADYESSICGKKWYWAIFMNCLSLLRVAAWRTMVNCRNGAAPMDQLDFIREIVKSKTGGFHRLERLDNLLHIQIPSEKQGRCEICRKNTRHKCGACGVLLHDACSSLWIKHRN
jgi:hypothetical protein